MSHTTFAWTDAPMAYDYWYVETIKTHGEWRKIEIFDQYRFDNFQRLRYASGGYQVRTEGP